jgi:hypothetical protein
MASVLITGPLVEAKLISEIDDHSHYSVIAKVLPRPHRPRGTHWIMAALAEYGVREEVLSDMVESLSGHRGVHSGRRTAAALTDSPAATPQVIVITILISQAVSQ